MPGTTPVSWKLLDMRARIRLVDTQLVVLLARRFEIMREVRAWKQSEGLPLIDPERERDVLEHGIDLAQSLGVPESIVHMLYRQLFQHVRGTQDSSGLTQVKEPALRIDENSA